MSIVTVTRFLEFSTPEDKNWIPSGYREVELKIPQDLYDEDEESSVEEAAIQWCDSHGYSFCQFLDDSEFI